VPETEEQTRWLRRYFAIYLGRESTNVDVAP
jgi:hypothetical protein